MSATTNFPTYRNRFTGDTVELVGWWPTCAATRDPKRPGRPHRIIAADIFTTEWEQIGVPAFDCSPDSLCGQPGCERCTVG